MPIEPVDVERLALAIEMNRGCIIRQRCTDLSVEF